MQLSKANGFVFIQCPDLDIIFMSATIRATIQGCPCFPRWYLYTKKLLHICAHYPWHIASIMAADGLVTQGSKAIRMVAFTNQVDWSQICRYIRVLAIRILLIDTPPN